MPLSTTFGTSSARNYGFKARSLVLNTQTFTSSTTFTAPSTTNNLLTVVGQGQAGTFTAGHFENNVEIGSGQVFPLGGPGIGSALDWSSIIGSGGDRNVSGTAYNNAIIYSGTNKVYWYTANAGGGRVRGTVSINQPNGAAPSSGQITYDGVYNGFTDHYWVYQITAQEFYVDDATTTGASTTGFGQTFVGGTGGAATAVTYNNVAVTPNQAYTLTVPSGGSIQISYYS